MYYINNNNKNNNSTFLSNIIYSMSIDKGEFFL